MSKYPKSQIEYIYRQTVKQMEKLVGRSTTYLTELNKSGKKLFGPKFIGVFASDTIPKHIPKGACLIVNLDNSKGSGEHWLSVCKHPKKNELLVYDSFGRNLHHIIPTIFERKERIKTTEKDREQKQNQNNCGARCLAFIAIFLKYGFEAAKWI